MIVMANPLEILARCHFELGTPQRRRRFFFLRISFRMRTCVWFPMRSGITGVKHDRVVAERGVSAPCRTGKPQKPIWPRGTGY
jgi:hypothetical protein